MGSQPGPPSARLVSLLAGDLPGHRRLGGGKGRARFAPIEGGLTLDVTSRTERGFLGRTEISVFETAYAAVLPEKTIIEMRHTGGLRRSGLTARSKEGGDTSSRLADALASDRKLIGAAMPLDFTRFELHGDQTGCRAQVELMGASHVSIALPPIRSYVHLHFDQREALLEVLTEVGRVVNEVTET